MTAPTRNAGPRTKGELTLPALKSLGELANAQPIIEIDSREQAPLLFTRLQSVRVTLSEGDYGISGVVDFAVERKGSLDELASCCIGHNRDRFERELVPTSAIGSKDYWWWARVAMTAFCRIRTAARFCVRGSISMYGDSDGRPGRGEDNWPSEGFGGVHGGW